MEVVFFRIQESNCGVCMNVDSSCVHKEDRSDF